MEAKEQPLEVLMNETYTIREAMEILGVSYPTMSKLLKTYAIPSYRIGHDKRIWKKDVHQAFFPPSHSSLGEEKISA